MALVAFEQEDGHPPGMGTFHFDDGRTLFAHDPELSKTVPHPSELDPGIAQAAMGGEDERTASVGSQGSQGSAGSTGSSGSVGSQGSQGSQPEQRLDAGGPVAQPQVAPVAPAVAQVAAGGGPASPSEVAAADPMANVTAALNSKVRVAPTRGGVIPKSQSQTIESDGVAYDEEHVASRQAANNDMMVARKNEAANQAHRAQAESLHYQAQLPELQKKAAAAQQEQEAQHNAYKQERAHLEQMIQESQTAQKGFNANRWFESRGAIGQIGAVLAQAMGAYAATLGRGENWAQKIIDGHIANDIAEQKEQIAASKGNVDNALNRLKLRFGDMGQAESALKIAMGKAADTQALAYAKSTGAQDIQDTWTKQVAQNQVDRVKEEQAFEAASKGKVKTTTDARIVAPSAGGYRDKTVAEKRQEAGLYKDVAGVSEAISDADIKAQKARGGVAAKDPKDFDKDVQEYGVKRSAHESADTGIAAKIAELQSLQKKHGGSIPGRSGLKVPFGGGAVFGMGSTGHTVGSALGSDYSKDALRADQLVNDVKNLAAQANKGPATDEDIERIMSSVQGKGTDEELFNGLRELHAMNRNTMQGLGGAYGVDVVSEYEKRQRDVRRHDARKEATVR